MLNAQQIFDKVATHLFTQGEPAKNGGTCKYRDSQGRSCAVGCLIPPDKYDPSFENGDPIRGGNSIAYMINHPQFVQALADGGVDAVQHLDLLRSLQNVHDEMGRQWWNPWLRERLEVVAEIHGLSTQVLPEAN